MSIRKKLILGSLLAMALLVAVGTIGFQLQQRMRSNIGRLAASSIPETENAAGMMEALLRARLASQRLLTMLLTRAAAPEESVALSKSETDASAQLLATLNTFADHLNASREATETGLRLTEDGDNDAGDTEHDEDELKTLKAIESGFKSYRSQCAEFLRAVATNPREARRILEGEAVPQVEQLEALVEGYHASQMAEFHRDTQEVLTSLSRSNVLLLASILLALAISVGLGVSSIRSILRPIQLLTAASERIAAGESNAIVDCSSRGELGQLAKAFNEMSGRIEARDRALREVHASLEERVRERTGELAATNAALEKEKSALYESEQRFQQIERNIEQVFWMGAAGQPQVIYVSAAYERIWGRTCASLYADFETWIEATVVADREMVRAALARNFAGETYDIEFRITRPEGTQRWIRDRGFPVRDETGRMVNVCGLAEDITARKQASEKLAEAERQLREASRQAGMAEVATSVLHNVGNVLNSANVSMTLVSDRVKKSKVANFGRVVDLLDKHAQDLGAFFSSDAQGRKLPGYLRQLNDYLLQEQAAIAGEVESLRQNIEHIKEIVSMQQNYATVSGVTEMVGVIDLVEDSLRMNAAALARHEIAVVRDFREVPEIGLEKHKVLQILVNLIRNAKYACDEGGQKDKRLTLQVANGGDRIKISISDNGIGIPPENLTRIFNHGFTTRKEGHGFGLHSGALAAKEMGGALKVRSEGVGRGATFTLELPVVTEVKGKSLHRWTS